MATLRLETEQLTYHKMDLSQRTDGFLPLTTSFVWKFFFKYKNFLWVLPQFFLNSFDKE